MSFSNELPLFNNIFPTYFLSLQFVLDGVQLMKRERENVGTEVIKQTPLNSGTAQILVVEPLAREPEAARPRNKTGKVRLAVIPNMDGTYDGLPPELDNVSLSGKVEL